MNTTTLREQLNKRRNAYRRAYIHMAKRRQAICLLDDGNTYRLADCIKILQVTPLYKIYQ
jgi:hypothetical protein